MLTVLFAAHVGVGHAQAPPPRQDVPYNWYSEPKNPEAIGYDIVTLFSLLYLRDKLPLDSYEDPTGKSVLEIMREQRRFVGPAFPTALDLLLCHLNPEACKIASVGGASKAIWSGKAGTTYMLPAITFEPYRTAKRYEKTKDERVEDIVLKKTWGCERFDQACRDTIAHLNPSLKNPFDPTYAGPIVLPGFGVKARVPGLEVLQKPVDEPSPQQRAAGTPTERARKEAEAERVRKIREEEAIHKIQRSGKIPDSGTSYKAIQKNIPAQGPYRTKSSHIGDKHYQDHQRRLFQMLDHPLHEGPLVPRNRVVVVVLDTWVDPTHCEFQGPPPAPKINNKPRPAQPGAAGPPPPAAPCREPVVDGTPADHGTHVAGLIGAKINGFGTVGINPFAQIVTYEADASQPLEMKRLIEQAVLDDGARIVNISMTSPAVGNDPVLDKIKDLGPSVLFVAAAGNEGLPMDDRCTVFPACYYHKPNVITVVALDDNDVKPNLWSDGSKGSNYAKGFHLGVPAVGVVSSTVGGRHGRLSGTSQAVPIVAGAASLLYMENASLAPVLVKERLIYTSDLFPSLLERISGGRLNVGRALKMDQDVIVKRNGDRIEGRVRKENVVLALAPFDEAEEVPVPLARVKRIVRTQEDEYSYTVFSVKVRPQGERLLEPRMRVKLPASLTLRVQVKKPDGTKPIIPVRLDEIQDFTSRLTED